MFSKLQELYFRGQSPADAEFNFLEVAKNLDLYGVDLNFAKVKLTKFHGKCQSACHEYY